MVHTYEDSPFGLDELYGILSVQNSSPEKNIFNIVCDCRDNNTQAAMTSSV